MGDAEKEVLAITERMLQAMYTADPEVHRRHCAEDMSSFEWYIAPYRIDGVDFHLRLIESGGNGEPSHLDMLTPRVPGLRGYGHRELHPAEDADCHGSAAAVFDHQRDARLCEDRRDLEDGPSPQVPDFGLMRGGGSRRRRRSDSRKYGCRRFGDRRNGRGCDRIRRRGEGCRALAGDVIQPRREYPEHKRGDG